MLGSSRKPSSTIIFGDFGGGRSHPRCPCLSRRRRLVSKHSASKVSLHLRSRGVLSRVWSLGLRQDHQVRPQAHLPGSCEFCSAICLALWAPRPLLQALCALRPTSSGFVCTTAHFLRLSAHHGPLLQALCAPQPTSSGFVCTTAHFLRLLVHYGPLLQTLCAPRPTSSDFVCTTAHFLKASRLSASPDSCEKGTATGRIASHPKAVCTPDRPFSAPPTTASW